METLSLVDVWSLANATTNNDLIETCAPRFAMEFNVLTTDDRFLNYTNVDSMGMLLTNLSSGSVTEETKLRAIAAWINSPKSAYKEEVRADYFEDFLTTLELNLLSPVFMVDLSLGQVDFDLPPLCKKRLLEAWKKEITSPGLPGSSTSVGGSDTNRYM